MISGRICNLLWAFDFVHQKTTSFLWYTTTIAWVNLDSQPNIYTFPEFPSICHYAVFLELQTFLWQSNFQSKWLEFKSTKDCHLQNIPRKLFYKTTPIAKRTMKKQSNWSFKIILFYLENFRNGVRAGFLVVSSIGDYLKTILELWIFL